MIKIPISADPSGTVSALEQISTAIRKAGQEGRKFAEIDFSHEEIKPFADDIKRLQANFEELKKVGRGATAASVRKGGYDDVLEWYQGHGRQFPDAKQRRNHSDAVSNYVSQGTRWEPSAPSEGGGGKRGGGFFGGLPVPGMGKLLGIGLGIAGIGKISSMVSQGVKSAQDESIDIDTFKRMLNDTSTEFDDLRKTVREAGDGLQITYNETIKLAQVFAKTSAYTDAKRVSDEVESSTGFARAFGMNPNQTTQLFGKARWLQAGGGKDAGPKEMTMMFAEAIASGNMWGKADEVLSAIVGWVQHSERIMVDSPNVKGYVALTSAMNASDRPGLRGQAGAALISQMDNAIRSGGGAGDAGQNFLWRALSPDGKMGPFQMRMQQEKGMFGKLDDGRTNLEAAMQLAKEMYGNPLQRADALSRLFNTSMTQMTAMMDLKPGSHGKLSEMMKKYGIDPKTINATAYQGLATVAMADDAGLESLRADTLKRSDLTKAQKGTIRRTSTGNLRGVLAKTLAVIGREQTRGTKTLGALTEMKNALTSAGSPLLMPINEIKNFVAKMAQSPLETAENFFNPKRSALAYQGEAPDDLYDNPWASSSRPNPRSSDVLDRARISRNKYDQQREIKVTNEVVVIHKNEKGGVLKEERLPAQTVLPMAE